MYASSPDNEWTQKNDEECRNNKINRNRSGIHSQFITTLIHFISQLIHLGLAILFTTEWSVLPIHLCILVRMIQLVNFRSSNKYWRVIHSKCVRIWKHSTRMTSVLQMLGPPDSPEQFTHFNYLIPLEFHHWKKRKRIERLAHWMSFRMK